MIALLLAAALTAAPQEAPRPPALTNAEACLRDKADVAVAASSGASDAAAFLLDYLCAGPVDRAAAWQRNTDALAAMKTMFKGMENNASLFTADPEEADAADTGTDADVDQDAEAGAAVFANMFDGLDDVRVDPVTGELIVGAEASSAIANIVNSQTNTVGQMISGSRPVFLRELAGQLVLEARGNR